MIKPTPCFIILFYMLFSCFSEINAKNPNNVATIHTGVNNDLSDSEYKKWEEIEMILAKKHKDGKLVSPLTTNEKKRIATLLKIDINNIGDEYEPDSPYPWNVYDWGCSWYCGASYNTRVSSSLPSNGKNIYDASSIVEDDTRTAWVEGVKGYGIGEYIDFIFNYGAARATSVFLVNGYAKNERTWKNNSRVKTFNVYENENLIAIVNLADKMAWQSFSLPHPIPNRPDNWHDDYKSDAVADSVVLRFLITDVYPGDKYDDTAISAIIFDGKDVHCLAKGTKIAVRDSTVNIEDIKIGDKIEAIEMKNTFDGKYQPEAVVKRIHKATHKTMLKLGLKNGMEIITTPDHPFYTSIGWASYDIQRTKQYERYKDADIKKYELGVIFYADPENSSELESIDCLEGEYETYSLELNEPNLWYIANGFLVGQE